MARTCVGFLAAALLGCATTGGPPAANAPRSNPTAQDLYPLAQGWRWAYDVEKDGVNILATYAVLERTGEVATVQAGDERLTYAVSPDGIAQKEGGGVGDYLIRNPVKVGNEWPVAGGRARIVAVDQEVTVEPAGRFKGCVIVEVTRSDPMRVARTTYAPEIGPIALDLQVQEGQQFVTATRARLRAVTKPGEGPF